MAEKKGLNYDNIIKARDLLKDGSIDEMIKSVQKAESEFKSVKSKLEERLKIIVAKKSETIVEPTPSEQEKQVKPEIQKEDINQVEEVKVEVKEENAAPKTEDQPKEGKKVEVKEDVKEEPKRNEFVPERPSFIVRRQVPIAKQERPKGNDEGDRMGKRRLRLFQRRRILLPLRNARRNARNHDPSEPRQGSWPRSADRRGLDCGSPRGRQRYSLEENRLHLALHLVRSPLRRQGR
jgi:hypothetical protein